MNSKNDFEVITQSNGLTPNEVTSIFRMIANGVNQQGNMVHVDPNSLIESFEAGNTSVVLNAEGRPVSHARFINLTNGFLQVIGESSPPVSELGTVFTDGDHRGRGLGRRVISGIFDIADRLSEEQKGHIFLGTLTNIQMARILETGIPRGYRIFIGHHHAPIKLEHELPIQNTNPLGVLTCVCNENVGPVNGKGVQFGMNACPIRTSFMGLINLDRLDEAIEGGMLRVSEEGKFINQAGDINECLMFFFYKDDDPGRQALRELIHNTEHRGGPEVVSRQLHQKGYYES